MARIGQLLVRANLVSENNLARALGVQHFAGGRLGTLLLERGSVSEDDLGATLADQHGCEYVPWRVLGDVAPGVIAALPEKFAIKHSAVPYERGEGLLRVALRDPGDLRILDELFFVTGRKIVPAVAPEVRLYQALEKYYGERRTPRFAILAEKLSRPTRSARSGIAAVPPPPVFFPDSPRRESAVPPPVEVWGEPVEPDLTAPPIIQDWRIPDVRPPGGWAGLASAPPQPAEPEEPETISWEEMAPSLWLPETEPPASPLSAAQSVRSETVPPPRLEASAPLPVAPVRPAPPVPPTGPAQAPGPAPSPPPAPPEAMRVPAAAAPPTPVSSTPPFPERPVGALPPSAPTPAPPTPTSAPKGVPGSTHFPDVASAGDRDAIAAACLVALAGRFARVAVFVCKPNAVCGWGAAGRSVDVPGVLRIEIPWNEPSIFLNVKLSRSFYLGPLPPLPRHEGIILSFGGRAEECLVQPVLIKEKPVAFLYAEFPDAGASPIDLAYMRELAGVASTAFVTAIRLKKKEI